MDRNHLKDRDGDRANAILVADGYNSIICSWDGSLSFCVP